jgi:hypothetical protein
MQLTIDLDRVHYRLHEANNRITGIEQCVAELHGARAPTTRWMRVWRVGHPLRKRMTPVVEEARRRLGATLRLAEAQDLAIIRWLESTGRASVPAWCWPDQPPRPPKRPQVQDWRLRREPGGWPPSVG